MQVLTAAAGPGAPSSGASRGVCLREEDRRRAADCKEEHRLTGKAHLQVGRSLTGAFCCYRSVTLDQWYRTRYNSGWLQALTAPKCWTNVEGVTARLVSAVVEVFSTRVLYYLVSDASKCDFSLRCYRTVEQVISKERSRVLFNGRGLATSRLLSTPKESR